jgi:hypothetical protein
MLERFTLDVTVSQLDKIYSNLLGASRGRGYRSYVSNARALAARLFFAYLSFRDRENPRMSAITKVTLARCVRALGYGLAAYLLLKANTNQVPHPEMISVAVGILAIINRALILADIGVGLIILLLFAPILVSLWKA